MKVKDSRTGQDEHVTFESILKEVARGKQEQRIGRYTFTELTTAQQRKFVNTGYSQAETFTVMDNIFNTIIADNVACADEMSVVDTVTVENKPFFLNVLRRMSLGGEFTDPSTGKVYNLPEVKESDLEPSIAPQELSVGAAVKVGLVVPTLNVDGHYNELLRTALKPYRRKSMDDVETQAPVYDLLGQYEIMKFIDTVSFNGTAYDFIRIPMEQKRRFLDSMPSKDMERIREYIAAVKEKGSLATLCRNDETGDEVQAFTYRLFLLTPAAGADEA